MLSANLSAGRYPDGVDSYDNIKDFRIQKTANLLKDAHAGGDTIVIKDVDGLRIGQHFTLGRGAEAEEIQIAVIGELKEEVVTLKFGSWTRVIHTPYRTLKLGSPLTKSHLAGDPMLGHKPTPGAPNCY